MQQSRPWKGKTGGGSFGQKSLFFLLKRMNVSLLYPVLFVVVPFYMLFCREGYASIMWYYKHCHNLSTWKAFRNTCRNHLLFGQVVLDKFAIWSGNKQQFKVDVTGHEYLEKLMEKSTGFIIASSHIGNFELAGTLFQQNKKAIYGLMYDGESAQLRQNREKSMQASNLYPISVKEDMSHLFLIKEALEKGNIVTIPSDRIYGSSKKIKHSFLRHDAYFPLGPFKLATQLNVPMIAMFVMKIRKKQYHIHIIPVSLPDGESNKDKTECLVSGFIKACEEMVEKYPLQWFNYYNFWKI